MPMLQCEVIEGPRPGFKAVAVPSMEGHVEYLTIEERFLVNQNDDYFLPVRVIGRDRPGKTALVQLPVEADSGANRVWVWEQNLEISDEVRA
jgi:hypothetical protein